MASIDDAFIVSGQIHWAFLTKKDNYGKYSFDLVLDEGSVPIIQDNARGLAKHVPGKYNDLAFIKVTSQFPYRVIMDNNGDGNFQLIAPENVPAIGNGSSVRCRMSPRQTRFGGKTYNKVTCYLIQVTKFIPYEGSGAADPLMKFYDLKAPADTSDGLQDFL